MKLVEHKSDENAIDVRKTEIKLETVEKQNRELKAENVDLKEKLLDMEFCQRRNNLIFEGIEDSQDENDLECIRKLRHALNRVPGLDPANFKIERGHRLDGGFKPTSTRRIICCFNWNYDAQCILRNRKSLPRGVYVNEDLLEEWIDRRRILKPIYNAVERQEKLKSSTFLKKDKLVIKGKTFSVAPESNYLDASRFLNLQDTCQRSDENMTIFLGIHSIFSNLHPSKFSIDNVTYTAWSS